MDPEYTDDDPTIVSARPLSTSHPDRVIAGQSSADLQSQAPAEIDRSMTGAALYPGPPPMHEFENMCEAARVAFQTNPGIADAVPIFKYLFEVLGESNQELVAAHRQFSTMLQNYQANLINDGVIELRARVMMYGLCATIDDIVLQSKNSLATIWSNKSMISLFFNETWGGERFFVFLSQMMKAAPSHIRELELYYLCLQFGFEGRYRLERSDREIQRIKDELFQFLRGYWGPIPNELSPSWRGATTRERKIKSNKKYWYIAAGSLFGLAVIYIFMHNYLHKRSVDAVDDIQRLTEFTPVMRPEISPTPPPPAPEPKVDTAPDDLTRSLADLQNGGFLKVKQEDGRIVINTTQEVFASASANLRDPYPALIEQVGKILNHVPGRIEVIGNTDSVPIKSRLYSDNLSLSDARARVVAELLGKYVTDGRERITSRGLGATHPIATNSTAEGRLANRRVEINLIAR